MPLHSSLSAGEIHVLSQWTYADAAARAAAIGFVTADVGKIAHQLDNDTLWMLTAITPTWRSLAQLSSDTEHSNLGGGALHADATQSVAGFLSAADKIAVDTFTSGNVSIQVRNETGGLLTKGTLVAPVGYSVAQSRILIDAADKDDPALRPCCGVLTSNIANNTNGASLAMGELVDVNTTAWALTDQLVLGNAGAFSRPPPDQVPFTGEVQNVGQVSRVDAANGRIIIAVDGMDTTTGTQVFALAGTTGTPSSTNLYVTDADPRINTGSRDVIVAKANGDYTTIAAGLAAAVALLPTAVAPVTVMVYPGVYAEATPLTVPSYVSLQGVAGSEQTIITPDTATDVVCQGSADSRVSGFRFSGASGVGGTGYRHSAGAGIILNCQVADCETGFLFTGATTVMTVLECAALQTTASMVTGFHVEASAKASCATIRVLGRAGFTVTDGFLADAATAVGGVLEIEYCDNGIRATAGAIAHFNSVLLDNCDQALYIDAVGVNTDLTVLSAVVRTAGTWDVICSCPTGKLTLAGQIDTSQVSLHATCEHLLNTISSEEDFPRQQVFGESAVGRYEYPARFGAGSGLPFFNGNKVLLNTNGEAGTWTNKTDEARSSSASAFATFPGVGAENCIYFGSDIPYAAIEIDCTAAIVPGAGAVVAEYWNGGAWVSFSIMATQTEAPYTSYGPAVLSNIGVEFVHFGDLPGWATKLLDGLTKYWARYRITSAITTSPSIEWMRCVPHTQLISADGASLFFGSSNIYTSLGWNRTMLDDLAGSTPSAENLLMSTNVSLTVTQNEFTNNAIDGRGGVIQIPDGTNTAKPLELTVTWYADGIVGDVEFEVDYVELPNESILDGTIADTHLSNIIIVPGVVKTIGQTTFSLVVNTLVPKDLVGFSLYRDATAGNADDTLAASTVLVDVSVHARFWK